MKTIAFIMAIICLIIMTILNAIDTATAKDVAFWGILSLFNLINYYNME